MAFLYSHWLDLSLTTRITIAKAFGIAKIGSTHVQDNRIVSDGFNIKDVENALTPEAMQNYTGSDSTDMQVLFDLTVAKAEGREVVSKIESETLRSENIPENDMQSNVIVEPKKKAVRKTKKK